MSAFAKKIEHAAEVYLDALFLLIFSIVFTLMALALVGFVLFLVYALVNGIVS